MRCGGAGKPGSGGNEHGVERPIRASARRLMGGRVLGLLGFAFFAITFLGFGFLFRYLGLIDVDLSDPLRPSDQNQFLALLLPSLLITIIALIVVGRISGINRGGVGGDYGGRDLDGDWGDGGSDGGGCVGGS